MPCFAYVTVPISSTNLDLKIFLAVCNSCNSVQSILVIFLMITIKYDIVTVLKS